jgi:hypothetical protein
MTSFNMNLEDFSIGEMVVHTTFHWHKLHAKQRLMNSTIMRPHINKFTYSRAADRIKFNVPQNLKQNWSWNSVPDHSHQDF